jgi:hypothetical protein
MFCQQYQIFYLLLGRKLKFEFSPFLHHPSFRKSNAYKGILMPYVNIQITKGATKDQKAQLVKEITTSLVRILEKKLEHTHIVI